MRTSDRRFSWSSFGLWIGLTLVGYLVNVFLHFPSGFAVGTFNPENITLGGAPFGFLLGAISGLIIASMQWIVLKSYLPGARVWLSLNAVGFGLVHALGDTVSFPMFLVVGGIIVGLAQYIALRHSLVKAILWIPIAAFAWFAGFQLGLTLPHPEGEYNLIIAALTYSVVTGLALRLLIRDSLPIPKNQSISV